MSIIDTVANISVAGPLSSNNVLHFKNSTHQMHLTLGMAEVEVSAGPLCSARFTSTPLMVT